VAKASLLRFVVSDGAIHADPLAREPGRGAYLCGRPECTEAALRRDGAALRRALRITDQHVTVNEDGLRSECEQHGGPGGPEE